MASTVEEDGGWIIRVKDEEGWGKFERNSEVLVRRSPSFWRPREGFVLWEVWKAVLIVFRREGRKGEVGKIGVGRMVRVVGWRDWV